MSSEVDNPSNLRQSNMGTIVAYVPPGIMGAGLLADLQPRPEDHDRETAGAL
jgi:hypothetical protein